MKLSRPRSSDRRQGAALLLSLMVLIVIGLIVYQIDIVTSRNGQVARNDVTLTQMDLAIESVLLQVYESLSEDLAAAAAEDGATDPGAGEVPPGGDAGGGEEEGSVDSKMDAWAQAQNTNVGELSLRIVVQDEDSKYNVLNMLALDEERSEEAVERVARILDLCREGTAEDIDGGQAEEMTRSMLEHLSERERSALPRPAMLSDSEENPERGMPISLREFVVLEGFEERHFRDYYDLDGERVHSIGSFLTVHSSPTTGEEDAEIGGYAVNINTAPAAVLGGLMDDRDVNRRFWDDVIEYRNEEEEEEPGEEETEPMLDEFGEEVLERKFFDDLEELDEVYDWALIEPGIRDDLEAMLTVSSQVFSIYVTARLPTQEEQFQIMQFNNRREQEEYERSGTHIVRTVRSVVWRRETEDGVEMVPLVRWEILDTSPLEVLDYDEDDY